MTAKINYPLSKLRALPESMINAYCSIAQEQYPSRYVKRHWWIVLRDRRMIRRLYECQNVQEAANDHEITRARVYQIINKVLLKIEAL